VNKNIMADIETMGQGNNAAIVAIGACAFDPAESGIPDEPPCHFYTRVSLQSSVDAGMVIDPSTVLWWMQQSEAARKATFEGIEMPLGDALHSFAKWVGGDFPVWGNGATFDNVIIRSGFAAVGLPVPWHYWNDRCYRTMKNLVRFKAEPFGTAHNAHDDAVTQALHLQKIYQWINRSTNQEGAAQ